MAFPHGCVHDLVERSPIGALLLIASARGLHGLYRAEKHPLLERFPRDPAHPVLKAAREQLAEYFAGERRDFELPLVLEGTDFQRAAWRELRKIPYGKTISYGEQARRIGKPKAMRAVGGANGRNPISIIVPCHRVIGADGSLTGFGWGTGHKRALLELESGLLRLVE